ncbi:YicC/YloC family endoribonuclease [Anderseniella sp. Alg231-50]|uniref:YicC/YloC family endoribonuclease n=1 Tax=Anderseniella sp. Alg231-50 TaxID=1922226 RepID=UPI000D556C25
MTISSMTGFGRGEGSSGPWTFQWEMRSVNGKSLDVRLRLPTGTEAVEQAIRASAAKHLKRSNVQVFLNLEKDEAVSSIRVNTDALAAAIEAVRTVEKANGGQPASTDAILAMRGVIEHAADEPDEEAVAARDEALIVAADQAIRALAANRLAEGERLATVVSGQLDRIADLTAQAIANPSRTPDAIQARLAASIERIVGTASSLEPERLHQEAMLAAAKADIQEELDRLVAHVTAARELLTAEGPVGRKFDFLAQEFNREANTLCSKSTDTSLTHIGLELKTVIDQLREQVQNIE